MTSKKTLVKKTAHKSPSVKANIFKASLLTAVGLLMSSCASTQPVGTAVTNPSSTPVYPASYGAPASERTLAQRLLDRSIEHTATVNIRALDPNLTAVSRIGVDSFDSDVLLTGEVPNEAIKNQVVTIVQAMPDVRNVFDELNIAPTRGYSSTVQDGYITSKLTAKMLANSAIKTTQIKTVTDNGVVYVMGRMTPTQQSHLIDIANQTIGVTELVLFTTLINDDGLPLDQQDIMQESNLEPPTFNRRSILLSSNTANQSNVAAAVPTTVNPAVLSPSTAPVYDSGSDTIPSAVTNNPVTNSSATNSVPSPVNSNAPSPYIELYKNQVQP